jgi:hypothetical protein
MKFSDMKQLCTAVILILFLQFGFAQIGFQEHVVIDDSFTANGVNSIYSIDLDNDGDMDVLSASSNDSKIAWYENTDGQGNFGVQQVITIDASGASFVYAADIDGDWDLDVLSTSYFDEKIAWYENIDGQGTFGQQQIVATDTNAIESLTVVDVDSDGDMDILTPNGFEPGII